CSRRSEPLRPRLRKRSAPSAEPARRYALPEELVLPARQVREQVTDPDRDHHDRDGDQDRVKARDAKRPHDDPETEAKGAGDDQAHAEHPNRESERKPDAEHRAPKRKSTANNPPTPAVSRLA